MGASQAFALPTSILSLSKDAVYKSKHPMNEPSPFDKLRVTTAS
jgi:hypothetical protein